MPLLQGKSRDPFVGARKGRAHSRESSLLPDVVLYTSKTSTREAKTGGFVATSSKPTWVNSDTLISSHQKMGNEDGGKEGEASYRGEPAAEGP